MDLKEVNELIAQLPPEPKPKSNKEKVGIKVESEILPSMQSLPLPNTCKIVHNSPNKKNNYEINNPHNKQQKTVNTIELIDAGAQEAFIANLLYF